MLKKLFKGKIAVNISGYVIDFYVEGDLICRYNTTDKEFNFSEVVVDSYKLSLIIRFVDELEGLEWT